MVVRSPYSGPMACRPMGSPWLDNPLGNAVLGRYGSVARPTQK
jgi:hypothetical protein